MLLGADEQGKLAADKSSNGLTSPIMASPGGRAIAKIARSFIEALGACQKDYSPLTLPDRLISAGAAGSLTISTGTRQIRVLIRQTPVLSSRQ